MVSPKRAAEILRTIEYATIATICPNGMPWNTPVWAAFDRSLNFYWASWQENQHSKNIAAKESIFVVVYDSRAPSGTGEGVYFQAICKSLENANDITNALSVVAARLGQDRENANDFMGDSPRRIYKAVPEKIWMNDDGTHNDQFVDIRTEIKLDDIIAAL